jgi:hypothetical protein
VDRSCVTCIGRSPYGGAYIKNKIIKTKADTDNIESNKYKEKFFKGEYL